MMFTVALPESLTTTSPSGEDDLMVRVRSSFPSHISSLFIGTLTEALVTPAVNVTVYGPEP